MERVRCRYCIIAYYNKEINDVLWHAVEVIEEFINSHGGWRELLRGHVEIGDDEWKSFINEIYERILTPLKDLYIELGRYSEFSIIRVVIGLVIDGMASVRDLYQAYRKLKRYAEILETDLEVYTRKCLGSKLREAEEILMSEILYETARKVCGKSLLEAADEVL